MVPKDLSKLTFHFQRTCSYLHPRTSMLMFGPKNAPAEQIQYLHIPEWVGKEPSTESVENLGRLETISNALVMTTTQFDGIPMADVFKLFMYWSFEAVQNEEEEKASAAAAGPVVASMCHVRMGLRIEYLKSTMLKSQIFAGTKDELVALSKQWEQYFITEVKKCPLPLEMNKPKKSKREQKKNLRSKTSRLVHELVSMDHIVDFEALFIKASVTKLHDCQLDAPSTALWRTGWQKSLGYR